MPYTQPYYVSFFENYGFRDFFKQFTFRTRLVMDSLSKIVVWKADRILKNPDYTVQTYGDIGKQKAIEALLEVYNKAAESGSTRSRRDYTGAGRSDL